MKSVGLWLFRVSAQYLIGTVRGHGLGTVAAVGSVVVVAQSSRSVGSGVRCRTSHVGTSRSELLTAHFHFRERKHGVCGYNVETTITRTVGSIYGLYQLIQTLGAGP
jgi:hypothetical protein